MSLIHTLHSSHRYYPYCHIYPSPSPLLYAMPRGKRASGARELQHATGFDVRCCCLLLPTLMDVWVPADLTERETAREKTVNGTILFNQ